MANIKSNSSTDAATLVRPALLLLLLLMVLSSLLATNAASLPAADKEQSSQEAIAAETKADSVDAALASLTDAVSANDTKLDQCMKVGGYCRSAGDCCSKRCLTYAAKCVT